MDRWRGAPRRHLIGTGGACAICRSIEWIDRSRAAVITGVVLCPGACALIAAVAVAVALGVERARRARMLAVALLIPVATAVADFLALLVVRPTAC